MHRLERLRPKTRVGIAAGVTIVSSIALEFFSIHYGPGDVIDIAFLAVPAAASMLLYRGLSARLLAFALLTVLSFATAMALIVAYLAM